MIFAHSKNIVVITKIRQADSCGSSEDLANPNFANWTFAYGESP